MVRVKASTAHLATSLLINFTFFCRGGVGEGMGVGCGNRPHGPSPISAYASPLPPYSSPLPLSSLFAFLERGWGVRSPWTSCMFTPYQELWSGQINFLRDEKTIYYKKVCKMIPPRYEKHKMPSDNLGGWAAIALIDPI